MPILVIVPTYNEAPNIEAAVKAILDRLPAPHEILITDDNSPDGTGALADAIAAREPRVHVLHRPGKQGLGPAYLAAFAWALERGHDAVVTFDADGSHPAEGLPVMLEAMVSHDVVVGSRYVKGGRLEGWPFRRWLLSRCANAYAKLMTGLPVRDCTGGFNLVKTDVLRSIDLGSIQTKGYGFFPEFKFRAAERGFRFVEFPIVFRDRTHGVSKISAGIAREAFFKMMQLRWQKMTGAWRRRA